MKLIKRECLVILARRFGVLCENSRSLRSLFPAMRYFHKTFIFPCKQHRNVCKRKRNAKKMNVRKSKLPFLRSLADSIDSLVLLWSLFNWFPRRKNIETAWQQSVSDDGSKIVALTEFLWRSTGWTLTVAKKGNLPWNAKLILRPRSIMTQHAK